MRGFRAGLALLCVGVASIGAIGPASAAGGKQAIYDSAQTAFDKGDWATAAAGFASLLPSGNAPLSRPAAVIAVRYGATMLNLQRLDEARTWTMRGIAALPADDSELPLAWFTIGEVGRFSYDYPGAVPAYDKAVALGGPNMARAQMGLGYTLLTVDPQRAAATLDTALAAKGAQADKTETAQLQDLRARAALNAGDLQGARKWIRLALQSSGGLTPRVSLQQAEIRGDAAIISQLLGNQEDTREYLTYTGAGHLKEMDWIGRYTGELPICGVDDVEPQDVAILRFAIKDDGSVAGVVPVYASRAGSVAATFAETVSRWRWNPEDLKKVDGFWRSTLRLELRCQTRPSPESLQKRFATATASWLQGKGRLPAGLKVDDPQGWSAATTSDSLVSWLLGIRIPQQMRNRDGSKLDYESARKTLDDGGAPASAYAMLAYRQAARAAESANGPRSTWRSIGLRLAKLAPPLIERFPQDQAMAWLMLEWAIGLESGGSFADAKPVLQRVLAMPTASLPADDPLRRVAALHAALVAGKLGDPQAAQTIASAAGISAGQCDLFDTRPIASSMSIGSEHFPQEAMRWHFEGHVEEMFDIGNDGRVTNIRTVVAYPPFVFGPDTEKGVQSFRYVPPKIGDAAVGCSGQMTRVNYRIPS